MALSSLPSKEAFALMSSGNTSGLSKLTLNEISFILPSLVRAAFLDNGVANNGNVLQKKQLKSVIKNFEEVNFIYDTLNINFTEFKDDIVKNRQLREKMLKLNSQENSQNVLYVSASEYENSNPSKKMRMVLSELLRLISLSSFQSKSFQIDDGELFQCEIFLGEVSNAICIAHAELPNLLPIAEISEALLHVKNGPWIITKLIVNNPDSFNEVCSCVIRNTGMVDESDIETQVRMTTLSMLCRINPAFKKHLRTECVSNGKLPGLAIELSITESKQRDGLSDVAPFFLGLLLTSDTKTRDWIADFIKTSQKDHKENSLSLFKRQLIKEMNLVIQILQKCQGATMEVDDGESDNLILNHHLMHGISIMKLYCSLKTMTGFKLSFEESDTLLNLITAPTDQSSLGIRYVTVAICTFVSSSNLMSNSEREEKLKDWLISLTQLSSKKTESFSEILLLITIHFHNSKLEPIVDLICSTLGIKVKPGSLAKMKILFTQDIFPEKVVAAHAITVNVTKELNKNITQGFLPAHCVLQLMRTRIFTKHDVSVQEWLYRQICSCTTPIHPIMLELIDAFVQSIMVAINVSKTKLPKLKTLQPFDEEEIAAVFSNRNRNYEDENTTKILLMFYLLKYQDSLFSNMKSLVNNPKAPRQYSTHLYSMMPMKRLLLKTRSNEHLFGDLYPSLLKLLTTYYPHLCLVEDWLAEEEIQDNQTETVAGNPQKFGVVKKQNEMIQLTSCPQKFIQNFSQMLMLSPEKLSEYEDLVVNMLPKLLEVDVPKKMIMLVCQAWIKINTVSPNSIWHKTVNTLLSDSQQTPHTSTEYTDEEIQKDPLMVLRCDPRVFRTPLVFDILLRVLNSYLTASKSAMNHHLMSNPIILGSRSNQEISMAEQEREELKMALVAAQESAAIQILLEICIPSDEERKNQSYATQSVLREIQCKCCCYIHQSFIKNPNMAKLVHFQGYPPELLSVTVPGIPSMHICLDFIPELLNQTHLEKQLFAVQLASHLAVQFPIPKSYSISLHVMNRLNDLLMALPSAKRNQMFVPALRCVLQICKAFPPIRKDAAELFLRVGKIASNEVDKKSKTIVVPVVEKKHFHADDTDDGMEVDNAYGEVSPKISVDPNSLSGNNPAYNRCLELKAYSCTDLKQESENAFKELTEMSLSEKFVRT